MRTPSARALRLYEKSKGEGSKDAPKKAEKGDPPSVTDMAFEDAADDVLAAIGSGDKKAFRKALKAALSACD